MSGKRHGLRSGTGGNLFFLFFLVISLGITMLPFFWMVSEALTDSGAGFYRADTSPGPGQDGGAASPKAIPEGEYGKGGVSLDSFRRLFEIGDVSQFMANSMVHALGYTLLSLTLNSLAAYAFARIAFPGRDRLFTLLILTMMIPSQVIMIPVFMIVKSLGLLNSYLGLIIPGCAHAYGIFTMRQFIRDIPDEIFEAAKVDGCGDFDIFLRIALPLSQPILATLSVTSFVYTWDQFLFPLVIMQDEPMFTLPVALVSMTSNHSGKWGVLLAGGILTALPSLIIFLLSQRAYISGITAGAVKK